MTIGNNIYLHRKRLGMSQEELGQKLLVSRQTISLWEKGQTIPTIDNLIRLKEIFGVSIDEILCQEEMKHEDADSVKESYKFNYSKNELSEIYRFSKKLLFRKQLRYILAFLFLLCLSAFYSFSDEFTVFMVVILFIIGALYIRQHISMRKAWNKSQERIIENTYEYNVYDDYFIINIQRNCQTVRMYKVLFSEIDQIYNTENYLIIKTLGQYFILRKNQLPQNSAFYVFLQSNPTKMIAKKTTGKWEILSWVLFIGSILSIFGALFCVGIVSNANNLFVENMWIYFLFLPITVASIVVGLVLKHKGYKYKKNIIVGIGITILLCIYGSFRFIFADTYDHSDKYLLKAEQSIGIDFPEHKQINTQDFTKGEQSVSRGYIYYISDVYFYAKDAERLENQIAEDNKWMVSVPNDMIGIASPFSDIQNYDYVLIYNENNNEFNTLPTQSGTYRFICLLYSKEDNKMGVTEYDINYVK